MAVGTFHSFFSKSGITNVDFMTWRKIHINTLGENHVAIVLAGYCSIKSKKIHRLQICMLMSKT